LEQPLPAYFRHDRTRSYLGRSDTSFAEAKRAFAQWIMFDLGWVRVGNPSASIATGELVAVEAKTLRLCTLNVSRIVETVDVPARFGFVYSTTECHLEQGEERFLIEMDANEEVSYELEAVSKPRHTLARLGYPVTRFYQRRFVRDSHARMRKQLAGPA
jgi:uncharacterized protein (UPF0548 family)